MSSTPSAADAEEEYLRARNAAVPPSRPADSSAAPPLPDAGQPPAPAEEPLDDALGAEEAIALKDAGNAAFKAGDTAAALEKYAAALRSAHLTAGDRAVLWANRAAVRVRVAEWAGARKDATRALEFDPGYRKALLRRKLACERLCEWAPAAEDARALGCSPAEVAALDLRAKQKAEKETAEAVEQLKGLGNLALGAFGLSLDSFQMDKDPETGGYSVKMKQ